jgi:cysteine desulfurase
LFHCDAAQSLGKIPIDLKKIPIHLLSGSAHKIYGPKGVGFLYIRRMHPRIELIPLTAGGGHERGLRPGTLNAPGIVGLGKACEVAKENMQKDHDRILSLREHLREKIFKNIDHVSVNGSLRHRVAGNLNCSFHFIEGESLSMLLSEKGIAVSTGSACASAKLEPSHVLKALGLPYEYLHGSIRFGLGRFNTRDEIDYTIEVLVESVDRLRKISPLYKR